MEKKKNLINLIFSPKLLIIEWSVIIVFCIFIGFSIRGKCASQNSGLPYVITSSAYVNGDGYTINDLQNFYNIRWGSVYPFDFTNNLTLAYDYIETIEGWGDYNFTRVIIPNENSSYSIQLSQTYNNFNIFENSAEITFSNYNYVIFSQWGNQYQDCNIYLNQTFTIRFFFDGYMPKYIVGEYDFGNNEEYPVIKDGLVNPTISGEATQPDLTGDNIGNDKPDIDDYLPNIPTMPSLDNSSLEKIAESIYNILQWGFNAIKGILQGLFEYLADTFTYSIQKVIDNIKNAIQNFYDNMKSLFEPLLNGLAEIAQGIKETIENIGLLLEAFFAPFNESQFQEAYENCEFINALDGVNDSIEEFKHAFTYAEERDYYTLYLGFMMDGYTVNYDLDFTWLYPLRQYYRPIIWAVVIYEFFVYLCSQLSDYLQGRSGK